MLLPFVKNLKKHFFLSLRSLIDMGIFFFFLFQFYHLLSIGKRERGKWKKTTLNTSFQKKIRKENKTKTKLNAQVKEMH